GSIRQHHVARPYRVKAVAETPQPVAGMRRVAVSRIVAGDAWDAERRLPGERPRLPRVDVRLLQFIEPQIQKRVKIALDKCAFAAFEVVMRRKRLVDGVGYPLARDRQLCPATVRV